MRRIMSMIFRGYMGFWTEEDTGKIQKIQLNSGVGRTLTLSIETQFCSSHIDLMGRASSRKRSHSATGKIQ